MVLLQSPYDVNSPEFLNVLKNILVLDNRVWEIEPMYLYLCICVLYIFLYIYSIYDIYFKNTGLPVG